MIVRMEDLVLFVSGKQALWFTSAGNERERGRAVGGENGGVARHGLYLGVVFNTALLTRTPPPATTHAESKYASPVAKIGVCVVALRAS